MAVIRDVMPAFELFQPASIDDALALLERYGSEAWVLAGGLDSFDWLKDRAKRTNVVVDLSQIQELRGIREVDGGLEIGAMTTLTEVARHPVVRERYGLLMEAAELVASPQIRNQGTLGGNVSQDTRCWYYRSGWTCYRAGGNICYADTPTAINREHAILDADRCVAVSPSDTAPALIALDAKMVLRRAGGGERVVDAEDYFVGPGAGHHADDGAAAGGAADGDPAAGDVGGGAVLLREGAGPAGVGLPAGERGVGDEGVGRDDRDGCGWRWGRWRRGRCGWRRWKRRWRGSRATKRRRRGPGELATEGAVTLRYNGYKVPLMRNLVKRAIRGVPAATT